MKKVIYCIPGLGADERIFSRLSIQGYQLKFLNWIGPVPGETLHEYARRMAGGIEDAAPVLLGVSFGGMVAIEIAKIVPASKVIIVSSVKCTAELPAWMKWLGAFRVNKLVPIKNYRFTERFRNYRLGISQKDDIELVNSYRRNADLTIVKWSIHQILNWKNRDYPDTIFHIHGEKDKIFPVRGIKPTHIIKGGTHMMILNRAAEISNCISRILSEPGF